MRRAAIAALVVVALVAGLWTLGIVAPPAPTYQGDQLGMEQGETPEEYAARARASISDGGDAAWALVTFTGELSPAEAADAVKPARRVSAVVFQGAPPRAIPEPVAGQSRADVFVAEADRARAGGVAAGSAPQSVLVKDEPAVLRGIAADRRVFAVEALAPDARVGTFGISPVSPPSFD
ncbi:hypothetical protein [Corynebacterium lipophiloflavum]|uniref:Uncharacterized protein n=1 Tax=Corynebacterium lipophiloflavum (strain ATCC 700352 / DSM 44291 / CCUG 37336 / JCM 10383 / DMMZ 1944) TaxID=525263 RepID=C0XS24_CORLD|nr:hypothetical protein [Corynebacterium lipophiloflavum]EEI16919.1 hypothetical protein HMPREF0298_1244 [Corynebacterium lipophiloflavum DSM 44291]